MISLALFLKFFWKPKNDWRFPVNADPLTGRVPSTAPDAPTDAHAIEAREQVERVLHSQVDADATAAPLTPGLIAKAWSPFVIMAVCLAVIGIARQMEKNGPIDLGVVKSYYPIEIPTLHLKVERADRLQKVMTPELTGALV